MTLFTEGGVRLRSFRVTWAWELSPPHILGMTGVQDSQACSFGSESWGLLSSERPLCSLVACGTFNTLNYSPGCG